MKRYLIFSLAVLASLTMGCRRNRPQPRPTLPLVLSVAADTTGPGRVAAQAGKVGIPGHIVLFGEPSEVRTLAAAFQHADMLDNIDGRALRDSLPDFAGETVDGILDAAHAPYSQYLRPLAQADGLREAAVRGALFAWDSLSRAKVLVLTSPLHAAYGRFDIDTLQQLTGGVCPVLTPVEACLQAALDGGARHIAVWAPDTVRLSRAYESVFEEIGPAEATLAVITPRPEQDSCSALVSLLRQYPGTRLDALVLDGYDGQPAEIQAAADSLFLSGAEEAALLPPGFRILEPTRCLISATAALLRSRNLYTHRIQRPATRFYTLTESDGELTYVPSIH